MKTKAMLVPAAFLAASVLPLAAASTPAFARGSVGGGRGVCTVESTTFTPIFVGAKTFTVSTAGTVVVKADAAGTLTFGAITKNAGWTAAKQAATTGVEIQFRTGTTRKRFTAAGRIGYYGQVVAEVDTCS